MRIAHKSMPPFLDPHLLRTSITIVYISRCWVTPRIVTVDSLLPRGPAAKAPHKGGHQELQWRQRRLALVTTRLSFWGKEEKEKTKPPQLS